MPCDSDDGKSKSKGCLNAVNLVGRLAAMGLAVASAVLMATASQCTIILYNGGPAHTITYSNFSPFVYLVVANAMAAVMVGVAIFLSVWKKGKGKCAKVLLTILTILDVAAPALLYSSTGAAFATSEYLSYYSPNGRRVSVCNGAFGGTRNFCSQVRLAMYVSLAAAGAASAAQLVKNLTLSSLSDDDDDSSSSSGSDDCAHGCKH